MAGADGGAGGATRPGAPIAAAGFGGGGEEKSSPVEGPIALRTGKPLKSGLSAVWTIWG
jgi:hypothetical protein